MIRVMICVLICFIGVSVCSTLYMGSLWVHGPVLFAIVTCMQLWNDGPQLGFRFHDAAALKT